MGRLHWYDTLHIPPTVYHRAACAAVDIYNAGSGSLLLPALLLTQVLQQVIYRWVFGFLMTIVSKSCLSVLSASSSLIIGERYGTSCAMHVSLVTVEYSERSHVSVHAHIGVLFQGDRTSSGFVHSSLGSS